MYVVDLDVCTVYVNAGDSRDILYGCCVEAAFTQKFRYNQC